MKYPYLEFLELPKVLHYTNPFTQTFLAHYYFKKASGGDQSCARRIGGLDKYSSALKSPRHSPTAWELHGKADKHCNGYITRGSINWHILPG